MFRTISADCPSCGAEVLAIDLADGTSENIACACGAINKVELDTRTTWESRITWWNEGEVA